MTSNLHQANLELVKRLIGTGTFPQRIPIEAYEGLDAVNYSTVKHVLKSPRHYHHVRQQGTVQTQPMVLGTACHMAVLEPERFEKEVAVWTMLTKKGDKLAPRNGSEWDHFRRMNGGKTILTPKEFDLATEMRDAVRSDPAAAPFLTLGEAEVALVWIDPETQLLCKGRVDWITAGHFTDDGLFIPDPDGEPVIVGLKTAVESGERLFSQQSARLHYHLQWAMYQEGYRILTGKIPHMVEIAVESKPPHDPVTYEIGVDVTGPGLVIYREALDTVARCTKTNEWPGRGGGKVVSLVLPAYAAGIPSDDEVGLDMDGIDMSALEG